jgi:hypothetical protein
LSELYAGSEQARGTLGIADQGPERNVCGEKLLDEVSTDGASCSCYENHRFFSFNLAMALRFF